MKNRTLLSAIPEVFSLNAKGDYGRFVPRDGAAGMMRDTWTAMGERLTGAAKNVGKDARGKTQKSKAA